MGIKAISEKKWSLFHALVIVKALYVLLPALLVVLSSSYLWPNEILSDLYSIESYLIVIALMVSSLFVAPLYESLDKDLLRLASFFISNMLLLLFYKGVGIKRLNKEKHSNIKNEEVSEQLRKSLNYNQSDRLSLVSREIIILVILFSVILKFVINIVYPSTNFFKFLSGIGLLWLVFTLMMCQKLLKNRVKKYLNNSSKDNFKKVFLISITASAFLIIALNIPYIIMVFSDSAVSVRILVEIILAVITSCMMGFIYIKMPERFREKINQL